MGCGKAFTEKILAAQPDHSVTMLLPSGFLTNLSNLLEYKRLTNIPPLMAKTWLKEK